MSTELLLIEAGGQAYALPLGVVQEIRGWTNVTVLPTEDPACLGIINLRGNVLHVLDVRRLLNKPAAGPVQSNVVVVVNTEFASLGLLVDGVSDIISVDDAKISQADGEANWTSSLISGIVNYNDLLYPRIDIHKIRAGGAPAPGTELSALPAPAALPAETRAM